MPQRTVIIGQGHWGNALKSLFSETSSEILFLGSKSTTSDWKMALQGKPLVVLACPFRVVPETLKKLQNFKIEAVINASKGIDHKSLLTFSSLAKKSLKIPFATLSGPTFAAEVLKKKPSAAVLAGPSSAFLSKWANKISTSYFRIYVSNDPIGVEASGAMKNVLAIACGVSDGLQLGQNARAALLTRGLIELRAVVSVLGGHPASVFGLAGVGDLWLTATGDLSRNRQLGLRLGKGLSPKDALKKIDGTCEGLYTVSQVHKLAKKHKLDLPISEQIYKICFKKQNPRRALIELMTRELKPEEPKFLKAR